MYSPLFRHLFGIVSIAIVATPFFEVVAQTRSELGAGSESSGSSKTIDESARGRLRDDLHRTRRSEQRQPDESDFEWESLTKNGPASGSDPTLGDRRVASYYEFNDGHQFPYYLAKP